MTLKGQEHHLILWLLQTYFTLHPLGNGHAIDAFFMYITVPISDQLDFSHDFTK